MRRLAAVLGAVIAMVTMLETAASAAPVSAQSPYCGIHWGSAPKHAADDG